MVKCLPDKLQVVEDFKDPIATAHDDKSLLRQEQTFLV